MDFWCFCFILWTFGASVFFLFCPRIVGIVDPDSFHSEDPLDPRFKLKINPVVTCFRICYLFRLLKVFNLHFRNILWNVRNILHIYFVAGSYESWILSSCVSSRILWIPDPKLLSSVTLDCRSSFSASDVISGFPPPRPPKKTHKGRRLSSPTV